MGKELKIGFVGAGSVNFGGAEGPWDHASRLEKLGGVRFVGVADPLTDLAGRVLAARRVGPAGRMYAEAKVFADVREMLEAARPDAVFIGVPPDAHAGAEPPRNIELACASAGVHMFLEKPLGCRPPEELAPVAEALAHAAEGGVVVSVGYMFRYSRAVEAMRRIVAETPGGVRAVLCRYDCAYSEIGKPKWWDSRTSGGPVVEQATHFIDLSRLLAGEADLASVRAVGIDPSGPAGALSDLATMPNGTRVDAGIPAEHLGPRATAAVWKFTGGAVGSLTHGVLLHRKKYESELEVWGDGLRMVLPDPYGDCRLHVRRPHSEATETLEFAGDDPYFTEDRVFVDAVRTGESSAIRSTYADAMRTYELTWAIRRAAR